MKTKKNINRFASCSKLNAYYSQIIVGININYDSIIVYNRFCAKLLTTVNFILLEVLYKKFDTQIF